MSIVSTSGKSELRSYPPADDLIDFFKGIDWSDVGVRIRVGTSNLLRFAMKFSEKSYDFHEYLYDKICVTTPNEDLN